jgi:transcriptional regulator with XRE-family HTH domain
MQVLADEHATAIGKNLGAALRDARVAAGRTQRQVADGAGMVRTTVSKAERAQGDGFTLRTWSRVATAAGSSLRAYLERASAADEPRDAAHLRVQELLLRTSAAGGWRGVPELAIDDAARGTRFLDLALTRAFGHLREVAVIEVVDWLPDVGASLRDWTRRLARTDQRATATLTLDDPHTGRPVVPIVGGCWVLRATHRNRHIVSDHRLVFRASFPGSSTAWLRALSENSPIPNEPALLWVSVNGQRLWRSRL